MEIGFTPRAIVKPEANPDNYVWYLFYYNPEVRRCGVLLMGRMIV